MAFRVNKFQQNFTRTDKKLFLYDFLFSFFFWVLWRHSHYFNIYITIGSREKLSVCKLIYELIIPC